MNSVELSLVPGLYTRTPADLDVLFEKARKACGGRVNGDSSLELYIDNSFPAERAFMISAAPQPEDS